ncbi:MAG: biopolymer transporter ExbD [Puniceicoccales bacterium]|jgi:biopolymer transport protein ExbD|nr:biopolymer transporter ExbD [Puniceicoccales bacterium]
MRQRQFKYRRTMATLNELNVTPLLDLCFCLLIIFMIATPVLEQTTQIDLPLASKDFATPVPRTPVKPKVLALDKQGQLIYDGHITHEDALRHELLQVSRLPAEQQPRISVRVDGSLPCQRLFDTLSLVKQSGLSKVDFPTEIKD